MTGVNTSCRDAIDRQTLKRLLPTPIDRQTLKRLLPTPIDRVSTQQAKKAGGVI